MTQVTVPDGVLSPSTAIGTLDPIPTLDPKVAPQSRHALQALKITFHTPDIFHALIGRWRPNGSPILGWARGVSNSIGIIKSQREDNPFADMVLIFLENDLVRRKAKVEARKGELERQEREQAARGIDMGTWHSRSGEKTVLFNCGIAHGRALALFAHAVDEVIRLERNSAGVNATQRAVHENTRHWQTQFRQAVNLPVTWNQRLLPITRNEVRAGQGANLALLKERFGGLPIDDVMNRTLQPGNSRINSRENRKTQDVVSKAS